ncbi:MAG: hypothetical protein ACLTBV_22225 [Enterocloster bolteae]
MRWRPDRGGHHPAKPPVCTRLAGYGTGHTYRITPLTFGSGYYARPRNDVRYYGYIDEYAALFEPVTVNIAEGSIWSFLMPGQSSGCLTESVP